MKIFYHSCLFFITLITFNLNSQIIVEESKDDKKSDTLIKLKNDFIPKRETIGSTEAIFSTTWSKSNRLLLENVGDYGNPLEKRVDEKSLNTWSYSLEFRNYIHKNIAFQAGLSYIKNGESYQYKGQDSTFNYQSTYSYIAMPIRFLYYYGKEIKFFAGGGAIPQMFNLYKQKQQWTNSKNEEKEATIKSKTDYNTFVMSGCVNIGIQLAYSKSWSIYAMPEYRWQLNSSYGKQNEFRHYARVFSVNFGFVYQL